MPRIVRTAPWVTLAGNVALLVGLARDAVLHREDPTLAAREGLFTLGNAGHVLFAVGIGLITLGMTLFLPIANGMMHLRLFDHPDGPFAHALGLDGLRAAAERLT